MKWVRDLGTCSHRQDGLLAENPSHHHAPVAAQHIMINLSFECKSTLEFVALGEVPVEC